ncbi:hypothetical protein CEE45_17665 [Candidatus Heimdallarchaeota archaeon B3_Heim]|nr:MAG: hypothetical protein CEE45_17665 [Candidatus Heimdallarchaeota archaeon B3_Heim]
MDSRKNSKKFTLIITTLVVLAIFIGNLSYLSIVSVNLSQDPILTWTGENNFVADGANPDSAVTGTNFMFRVNYTDSNNIEPSTVQVWIDDDDDGYEPGEKLLMNAVNISDETYYDGKLYTFNRVLTNTNGNVKHYRFYAVSDGVSITGVPTDNSSVYVFDSSSGSGSAPTLDWTGEVNYSLDGVNPDSAVSGTTFEFRVEYKDTDNDAPAQIQLWIDVDNNSAYNSSEKYGMTEYGGSADYTAGRFFTKSLLLFCTDGCNINYRFYANDGTNEATTGSPVLPPIPVTIITTTTTPLTTSPSITTTIPSSTEPITSTTTSSSTPNTTTEETTPKTFTTTISTAYEAAPSSFPSVFIIVLFFTTLVVFLCRYKKT